MGLTDGGWKKFLFVTLVFVVIIGLFALNGFGDSNAGDVAPPDNSTDDGAGKQAQVADISLYPSDENLDTYNGSGPITIETTIEIKVRGFPAQRYENAVLCVYDRAGNRLGRSEMKPIVSPEEGEVFDLYSRNVTVHAHPEYIIVDHPELRNDSNFETQMRIWNHEFNTFRSEYGTLDDVQDRFDWPRTHEPGMCG